MSSPPSVILFDLDGTLVDSVGDIHAAIGSVLAEDGRPAVTPEQVRGFVGDGAAMLVQRCYEAGGEAPPADALPRFRERYGADCTARTRPYEGIPELLDALHRSRPPVRMAVVTNKPGDFSRTIVSALGLDRWLPVVLGPDEVPAQKPDPSHLRAALTALGEEDADDVVMVGDGSTDLLAGQAAGARVAAVLWGYRSREQLSEAGSPDVFCETVGELAAYLGAG
ncbi:MAG: HAD-IA family hydrolase [Acidobacteriota bacterium]